MSEPEFVIDAATGEQVPIQKVEAVAAVSAVTRVGNYGGDLPPDAAKRIENAMSEAVTQALADGVSDPERIKLAMLRAREDVKASMRVAWREFVAKQMAEAAAQEK
jgi:hypothetical protein